MIFNRVSSAAQEYAQVQPISVRAPRIWEKTPAPV